MTGFAFPEVLKAIVTAYHSGQKDTAWAIYQRFLPLMVYEQQPGVATRKELYRIRGLINSGHVRHPAAPKCTPKAASMLAGIVEGTLPGVDVSAPLSEETIIDLACNFSAPVRC